jgi:hypothetical protein
MYNHFVKIIKFRTTVGFPSIILKMHTAMWGVIFFQSTLIIVNSYRKQLEKHIYIEEKLYHLKKKSIFASSLYSKLWLRPECTRIVIHVC